MISRKLLTSLFPGLFLLAPVVGGLGAQEGAVTETEWVQPSAVNHDVAGKEACMVCHAIGASPILDVPADHEARGNETCMWCHAPDSPLLTLEPSKTPHATATEETDCMRCHAIEANPDVVEVPSSHDGRANATCMWCHVKVEGGGGGRR
jgi:hypothetical protein